MQQQATTGRVFLFLQGPHGPFFRRLAEAVEARGARVRRIILNRAEEAEWGRNLPATRFTGPDDTFEEWLAQQVEAHRVTDIVFYGDTKPAHRIAWQIAMTRGITVHNFEEGYLRPRYVTYERGGANAFSRLCEISLPEMAAVVGDPAPLDEEGSQDSWGDTRQHLWYSFTYYLRLMMARRSARMQSDKRTMPLWQEMSWYCLRALGQPYIRLWRWAKQARLRRSGKTYHLVLLQLSFDASMREHSKYENTAAFIEEVIDAFAEGAAKGHLLVFKAHPFENGRERLGHVIREMARDLGIADRVVFIDGGKRLARLMDNARSVITVNSTGVHQALWRGLPVSAQGRAIYRKPGLVSDQSLKGFFRHPRRPDLRAYWIFRRFMLATCLFSGSFYAEKGIRRLLKEMPEAMLSDRDPYDVVRRREPTYNLGEIGPRPLEHEAIFVNQGRLH
ncbi:capsule biosynthesis protein CapA [Rhodobacteraceae bacterium NNCM2]|nr:capsule biosynthesis protein CapA [Coraliihabitans acroporae]